MTGRAATVLALSLLAVSAPVFGQDGGAMKTEQTGVSRTIVVIGASYAGGWNPERPLAGHQIITKGVSGEESSQVRDRFAGDVIALKPHGVIIWGFINDIFRSDRARLTERLQRTRNDLVFMVESARKAGIVPILATEVTIRNKDGWAEATASVVGRILGKESYQEYINRHVSAINEWIRETAAREKILLLDFERALSDERGVRRKEFAKPDGSHISSQGYEALTRYADERLTAISTAK
jgi:lysophospholipase L1-like esterase